MDRERIALERMAEQERLRRKHEFRTGALVMFMAVSAALAIIVAIAVMQ